MNYTKSFLDTIWEKGIIVDNYDSKIVRKDACGAWIIRDLFGDKDSSYGWEVDHIVPKSLLEKRGYEDEEIDAIENLRPLNCANNNSKSDSYPSYKAVLIAKGESNISCDKTFVINQETQQKLQELFRL